MIFLFTRMWLMRTLLASMSVVLLASAWSGSESFGQSSSLFHRAGANPAPLSVRPAAMEEQYQTIQSSHSYFAVKATPKRVWKIGDLVTVVVRNKSEYKNTGKTDLSRDLSYKAQLKDWIRFKGSKLVPDTLPAGDPTVNFTAGSEFTGDGKMNRTNELITRITCQVVDVQPNGNLVLQGGTDEINTDGEKQTMTLTGTCRSEDIMADNTILSTQIYQLRVENINSGAVKDTMNRGWMHKLWDIIKPL